MNQQLLKSYKESLIQKGLAPTTIDTYSNIARGFLKHTEKRALAITDATFKEFLVKKFKVVKASTARKNYAGLRLFFLFLQADTHRMTLTRFPELTLPKSQVAKSTIITENELNQLLREVKSLVVVMCLEILFYAGLRLNECLMLEQRDVDLVNKQLHIRHGKGGKERYVPISDKLLLKLTVYKKQHSKDDAVTDRFLATDSSESLSQSHVSKNLKAAQEKLNWVEIITAHSLRHSYSARFIEQDRPKDLLLLELKRNLGHESLGVTEIYLAHRKEVKA